MKESYGICSECYGKKLKPKYLDEAELCFNSFHGKWTEKFKKKKVRKKAKK